ncbi:MAG: hypothetical protein LR015_11775 [Verrucomicrobia bacterium]|nr:hypothetical protein [Verrucomicrobiota bacterium]
MEFRTGPVEHRLLVGFEYYRDKFRAANHEERDFYVRLPNPYGITRDWALEFRFSQSDS